MSFNVQPTIDHVWRVLIQLGVQAWDDSLDIAIDLKMSHQVWLLDCHVPMTIHWLVQIALVIFAIFSLSYVILVTFSAFIILSSTIFTLFDASNLSWIGRGELGCASALLY